MAAMPRARDRPGSMTSTGWPFTTSSPRSGTSAPVMTLIRVDLPAPFSPTSAWTSPGRRSKDTSSSARTPANDLLMEAADSSMRGRRHDTTDAALAARPGKWAAPGEIGPALAYHSSGNTTMRRTVFMVLPQYRALAYSAAALESWGTGRTRRPPAPAALKKWRNWSWICRQDSAVRDGGIISPSSLRAHQSASCA